MPHSAAAIASCPQASGPGVPNINPVTRLSTDYLNHFTEALMALEMAADIPECLDDLRAWGPKTYAEHFAQSRFKNRNMIIDLYETAEPALRREVERLSDTINRMLSAARAAATGQADVAEVARHATAAVRSLIAELAALINSTPGPSGERLGSQAAIDAMFAG
jgi:signal transduction histidine kinase